MVETEEKFDGKVINERAKDGKIDIRNDKTWRTKVEWNCLKVTITSRCGKGAI